MISLEFTELAAKSTAVIVSFSILSDVTALSANSFEVIAAPDISAVVIESFAISEVPTEPAASSLAHTELAARSSAVRLLLVTSDVPTESAAKSSPVTVPSCIFAESTVLLLIVILFQVPQISPVSCTLPGLVAVAYGIDADEPIDIQADQLHRYTISSSKL